MILLRKRLSYPTTQRSNHIFLFTANSVVRNNGSLVMGAGCAKTVKERYKGIDVLFGDVIENLSVFGLQFVQWHNMWIGAFQTKVDWKNDSPMDVVQVSIDNLHHVALRRPKHTFHLPCPAVNHGGKDVREILPLLEKLPDNVIVYLDK